MYTFRSSMCDSSDLPGFDTATLNVMVLYYHLMTKWSGLGDSTILYRMGLSHSLCSPFQFLDPLGPARAHQTWAVTAVRPASCGALSAT
jgi:hypothetical protein